MFDIDREFVRKGVRNFHLQARNYLIVEKGYPNTGKPVQNPSNRIIEKLAKSFNVDPELLRALARASRISSELSAPDLTQLAIDRFHTTARRRREFAANLIQSGQVDPERLEVLKPYLTFANVCDETAKDLVSILSKFKEKTQGLDIETLFSIADLPSADTSSNP